MVLLATSHEIVAGYEGTDNTTDQLQHIHNCTQLVIITTHCLYMYTIIDVNLSTT